MILKTLLSLIAIAVAGLPTWIFLALRSALAPQGFWEQLAAGVIGYLVFGGIQIGLLFLLVFVMVAIWSFGPDRRMSRRARR